MRIGIGRGVVVVFELHELARADEDGEEALVEVMRRDLGALVAEEDVERGDELCFGSSGVFLVRAECVEPASAALGLDELDGEGVVSGPGLAVFQVDVSACGPD